MLHRHKDPSVIPNINSWAWTHTFITPVPGKQGQTGPSLVSNPSAGEAGPDRPLLVSLASLGGKACLKKQGGTSEVVHQAKVIIAKPESFDPQYP